MKRLIVTTAFLVLVVAKPELYKENEDFQYARSSTDEGSKSGYYGAQRGNMGGNYERAHNMDPLAQHQMSGLVKQVEGELGDAINTRTGSAFTAGNSRGVYGSGRYDLSGLKGRNFEESESSLGNTNTGSMSSYNSGYNAHSASQSSRYSSSQAHDSRYQSSAQSLHNNNAQALDEVLNRGTYGSGQQAARQSGYRSQAEYDSQAGYNSAYTNQNSNFNRNNYGSNVKTHVIAGQPARVIIRPGTTVTVPIAAQTYDANHIASAHDENSINSEAEVLNNFGQRSSIPVSGPKHYESSYSYRKQWEKHHTIPVSAVPLAIPTENPFPRNSEFSNNNQALYASTSQNQAAGIDSQSAYSKSHHSEYDSSVKSATSRHSGYNTGYGSQHSSNLNSDAYTHGAYNTAANTGTYADANNNFGVIDTRPKSYHSSYSYHKSWERQGDPYVIYPATGSNNEQSQSLTANSENQGSSHQYGSAYAQKRQRYSQNSAVDCDENGHIRVPRSYDQNLDTQNLEDLNQQSQNLEDFGQYNQNLEDLGQETQNLQDFRQYSQDIGDLGQETQNLNDFKQYNQNLEDLRQQSQSLQDFKQYNQNLEKLGQQSQAFEQHNQNLEGFGKQAQHFEQYNQNSEDLGQETQNLQNFGSQTHNKWDNLEDLSQQSQRSSGQMQDESHNQEAEQNIRTFQDFGQQTQDHWYNETQQQQNQGSWALSFGQNEQNNFNTANQKQETGNYNSQIDSSKQNAEHSYVHETQDSFMSPRTEHRPDKIEGNEYSWNNHFDAQTQNTDQVSYGQWNTSGHTENTFVTANNSSQSHSRGDSSLQNLWNKLNRFDQISSMSNNEYSDTFNQHKYNENRLYSNESNKNNFELNNNGYQGWVSTRVTEGPSTTIKIKTTETTTKAITDLNKNIRPQDIGRGDISEEELLIPTISESKPIGMSHLNNKPEEIGSLSLTKENETNTVNINKQVNRLNKETNTLENNEALSAVTIDRQGENETSQRELNSFTAISSNTSDETRESRQLYSETSNIDTLNNQNDDQKPKPVLRNHKQNSQTHKVVGQQAENLGFQDQLNRNLDQQNQNVWEQNVEDYNQQVQTAWKPSELNELHKRVIGSDQQVENLDQQHYSAWKLDHDLEQQSDAQQISNLGLSHHEQIQTQDFYKQRYSNGNLKLNDHSELPQLETSHSLQGLLQENKQATGSSAFSQSNTTTEKPGFWKSVSNKVVSWWKTQ